MIELFPYQRTGAAWLATKRFAYLADQMRLGKSAQAITAADTVGASTILVLCPAVGRINWTREFQQFSQRRRSITPVLSAAAVDTPSDVVVCSYDLCHLLPPRLWQLVIADEAHYLKSLDAARAAAVLGANGFVHAADRTWFLSGTPAPNNPAELWTVLYVCGVTALSYDQFVDRYCKGFHTPYGFKITGGQNLPELRTSFEESFLLRRTKAQVRPDMPRILVSTVTVEPGPVDLEVAFYAQWSRKDGMLERELAVQDAAVTAAGGDLLKLEAIAESVPMYRRYVGLQKVAPVAELISQQLEAQAYDKIVLFAWHRDVIEGLRAALAKHGAVTLYGGTPAGERQKRVDRFQTDPRCKVFIGQIKAAGTVIGLHAAHHGLIVEPSWVPADNEQAMFRMDNPLQAEQITVQFVSVAGPGDEGVTRSLAAKARMLSALFD